MNVHHVSRIFTFNTSDFSRYPGLTTIHPSGMDPVQEPYYAARGTHRRAHPLFIGHRQLKLKIFRAHTHSDQPGKIVSGPRYSELRTVQSRNFANGFVGGDELIYEPLRASTARREPMIKTVPQREILGSTEVPDSDMEDHCWTSRSVGIGAILGRLSFGFSQGNQYPGGFDSMGAATSEMKTVAR